MNKKSYIQNLKFRRAITSGLLFCMPFLITMLLDKLSSNIIDINGTSMNLSGIVLILSLPFMLFFDLDQNWSNSAYLLVLLLSFFGVGAISGYLFKNQWMLLLLWVIYFGCMFTFGGFLASFLFLG